VPGGASRRWNYYRSRARPVTARLRDGPARAFQLEPGPDFSNEQPVSSGFSMSDEGDGVVTRGRGRGRGGGRGRGRGRPRAEEMGEDAPAPAAAGVVVNAQPIVPIPPPENLCGMLLELLNDGPIIQSQVPSRWKRKYPDIPFTYQVQNFTAKTGF
jgi:hypothetical protein